ncbi:hypothetical protein Q4489_16590 [Thalassotalea sp. 1_MG-2023]|uniref:hypothetical protein n=1 Tax=Thalassotalea sp. 1_MG-2023 TaxID=3062680 RepID=UPI0026E3BDA8|nr:hypothetical protein [Thalassotalea sp. 1_MG-2023]MDO6428632.1 hypothetical protein [Thalassotalea sp. 1_MG-2023]
MDVINTDLLSLAVIILSCGLLLLVMLKLVKWSKKMPKGAFIFLALFPLISIFPIPPQEIKKLEKIKQQPVKKEKENSEPNEDSE